MRVAVSSATAAKRRNADANDRTAAITTVLAVVARRLAGNPLVKEIVSMEGPLAPELDSVHALFAPKSTGTIQKRATYLRIYDGWFGGSGYGDNMFFDESTVFKYVSELLRQGAAASRGASVRSALFFLGGLFMVDTVRSRSRRASTGCAPPSFALGRSTASATR